MTAAFHPLYQARMHLLEGVAGPSVRPDPEGDAARRAFDAPFAAPELPDVEIIAAEIPGPNGPVPVRVYVGRKTWPEPVPALIWMHGGAFTHGDLDVPEADHFARQMADRTGTIVYSVDYRLCTDDIHMPVPHDDCYAVYTCVLQRADEWGIDPSRIAVGGGSAGANLAASIALHAGETGHAPWQMLLAYPVVHAVMPAPSVELAAALAVTPRALLFTSDASGDINEYVLGRPVSGATSYDFGGRFESVASWVSDAFMALPGIILLMALYPIIGTNIRAAMAVFGILISPAFYRTTRAQTMNVRHELYVDAAKIVGLSDARIISRHVLRAVRGPLLIMSGGLIAAGIGIQAALEYLGMGNPTIPSWGAMMQDAFNNMYVAQLPIVWPAGLMALTILALVLLGNAMRDAFEISASELLLLTPAAVERIKAERAKDGSTTAPKPAGAAALRDGDLLQVTHLTIAYPTTKTTVKEVVRDVSFSVAKGEIHGIVGESGSGKSQTAFAILGILPPTARILGGQILFDGSDVLADPDFQRQIRGRRIGYIPQEPMANLDPSYTVGSQLNEGLRAATGVTKEAARATLLALLDRVGIPNPSRTYDAYPHQVSGGMAQRVLIAGAIASDPEFLIADEPTTALDVTVQADVLELLRELQAERGLGMILVTHNFGVVADICDRVSVMRAGRIVESNTLDEIFTNPQDPYTQMLLGSTLEGAPLRPPLSVAEEA